jgi:hypothetical protein
VNVPQMKNFVEFLLNMLYVYIFLEVLSNCKKTKTFIKSEIFIAQTTDMPTLLPSLQVKYKIMTRYTMVVCTYFFYEIIINGLLPSVSLIF